MTGVAQTSLWSSDKRRRAMWRWRALPYRGWASESAVKTDREAAPSPIPMRGETLGTARGKGATGRLLPVGAHSDPEPSGASPGRAAGI